VHKELVVYTYFCLVHITHTLLMIAALSTEERDWLLLLLVWLVGLKLIDLDGCV